MKTISLERSRWRLLWIWLVGSVLIFGYTITIGVTRGFNDPSDWSSTVGWVFPHLLPTLSLILSVVGANALNPRSEEVSVKMVYHRLVMVIVVAYLFLVFATYLLEGIIPFDLVQTMGIANFWLGPLQGVVSAALSVLFFSD
ncbi:MAG: hypothetical protein AAGJ40_05715 [Planctomycetota bacterium]